MKKAKPLSAQQVLEFPSFNFLGGLDKKNLPWLADLPDANEEVDEQNLHMFFNIMFERQEIWHKRNILKQPFPWTENKILRDYKYTNVYRELDRASQWLIRNVLTDGDLDVHDLVWKIIVYRFFNLPDTFEKGGVDLPSYYKFDPQVLWSQVVHLRGEGVNPYHSAYLQNLAFLPKPAGEWKDKGMFKDHAIIRYALPKIHAQIDGLTNLLLNAETPEQIMKYMEQFDAVGGFMSHEYYIDFCYAARYWKKPIMRFDQNDYTNVGPGASLGLRLIFPSLMPRNQKKGIYVLRDISAEWLSQFGEFKYLHWNKEKMQYFVNPQQPDITLHQCEMWLCEMSKYWKMLHKVGKQRSRFVLKPK